MLPIKLSYPQIDEDGNSVLKLIYDNAMLETNDDGSDGANSIVDLTKEWYTTMPKFIVDYLAQVIELAHSNNDSGHSLSSLLCRSKCLQPEK